MANIQPVTGPALLNRINTGLLWGAVLAELEALRTGACQLCSPATVRALKAVQENLGASCFTHEVLMATLQACCHRVARNRLPNETRIEA
jgi:hypothetical protein